MDASHADSRTCGSLPPESIRYEARSKGISGINSAAMRGFPEGWNMLPLFSPPSTPEYNEACEACIEAHVTY